MPAKGKVTVVLMTTGSSLGLKQTISSFFSYNTYPIERFIVLKDGKTNSAIDELIKIYKNITWIFTVEKVGQIAAIDSAYKFIITEFYLHLEEGWVFTRPGYIEYALNVFSVQPNAVHVETTKKYRGFSPKQDEKWRMLSYKQTWDAGYSLNPSLHRMADYTRWEGGFSKMTYFASFGMKAGSCEAAISMSYLMAGKHLLIPNISFSQQLRFKSKEQRIYLLSDFSDSSSTAKLVNLYARYENWVEQENKQRKNKMYRKPYQVDRVTKINDLYDFSKIGKIIPPTVSFNNNLNQTLFPQFDNKPAHGDVTVVMTTSGRRKYLTQALKSFFKFNTYPINKMIVVHDGARYAELDLLIKSYKSITWVLTMKEIGQLAAIDEAYKLVETQYYFHTEDDWIYLQSGFIEYSLHILSAEPMASGIWLRKAADIDPKDEKKYVISTYKEIGFYAGFSLSPSLHRIQDYSQWPGGYSNMTGFATFGMGAGTAEVVISMMHIMKGYYMAQSKRQFTQHIGYDGAQSRYWKDQYKGTAGSQRLSKIWQQYDNWSKK